MRRNLEPSVALIMKHEGGFVSHGKDPGGCTNHGITIGTYRRLIDKDGTCGDLRTMPPSTAEMIYRDTYWNDVRADELPPGVDLSVFDMGVNAGPRRAIKLLQRCVKTAPDGILGPLTLEATWAMSGEDLIDCYATARMDYYKSLSTWNTFGQGWARRVDETETKAVRMHDEQRGTFDEEFDKSKPPASREEAIGNTLLTLIRLLREEV